MLLHALVYNSFIKDDLKNLPPDIFSKIIFKWIFICDLIEAAFRSQAPLPPCGSEKSMRQTNTPVSLPSRLAPEIDAPQ